MAVAKWRKRLVCLCIYMSVCLSNGGSLPVLDPLGGMPVVTLKQQRAPPLQAEGDTGWKSTGVPWQPANPLQLSM